MSWKPDFTPMAKAAELINSKPCSPSLEELQALLRKGYLASLIAVALFSAGLLAGGLRSPVGLGLNPNLTS